MRSAFHTDQTSYVQRVEVVTLLQPFCESRKGTYGSGARIRVTPFELQRKFTGIPSAISRPLEPKQLDWWRIVVSNSLYPVHCTKETLVQGEDGGDQRNPSDYSAEYTGDNISS